MEKSPSEGDLSFNTTKQSRSPSKRSKPHSYVENVQQVVCPKLPNTKNGEVLPDNFPSLSLHVLLQHPLLSSPLDQFFYIDKMHNCLASFCGKLKSNDENAIRLLKEFQKYAFVVTNNSPVNWKWRMPIEVTLTQGYASSYFHEELYQLIRLIRNYSSHSSEIQQRNLGQNSNSVQVNLVQEHKPDALFLILNSVPNVVPTLKVYEETAVNDGDLGSQAVVSGFCDRHADARFLLFELCYLISFEKQNGGHIASCTVKTQGITRGQLDIVRHTENHPNKNTTVVMLGPYNAKIIVLPYGIRTLKECGPGYNFGWNYNEWEAEQELLIITDDIQTAVDIFKELSYFNATVLIGVEKGDLQHVKDKIKLTQDCEYKPVSWEALGESYKSTLMSRLILLSGKRMPLKNIGKQNDPVFSQLKGELLLQIINNQQPEVLNTERNKFSRPEVYVPMKHLNIWGKTCIVTGSPLSGKSSVVQDEVNSSGEFLFILQTKEFFHWFCEKEYSDVCTAIAEFLADADFGRKLIKLLLTNPKKTVQIIFDGFEAILDECYDNSQADDGEVDNDETMQMFSRIIEELKCLEGVFITIVTRKQCVKYLEQHLKKKMTQPNMSAEEVKQAVSIFKNTDNISEHLQSALSNNQIMEEMTPLMCKSVSRVSDTFDVVYLENNFAFQVLVYFDYCKVLLKKRENLEKPQNPKAKKAIYYDMCDIHTYVAYNNRFPNQDVAILDFSVMVGNQSELTVSSMDYGLLNLKKYKYDSTRKPSEQKIGFIDDNLANYWISFGIIYLSNKFLRRYTEEWKNFVLNNIFCKYHPTVFKYLLAMFQSSIMFNDQEKNVCKGVLQYCIDRANPNIADKLRKLVNCQNGS